jgi:uncharacterized membrane protein YhaH (DUF805 family)
MEKQEADYNIFDWWKKVVFKNYANFNGRARRKEYWSYVLVNFLMYIPAYIIVLIGVSQNSQAIFSLGFLVVAAVALGTFIPSLAVVVRRFHDNNNSGWSLFMYFIPLVGPIIVLVKLFTEGTRGSNNYGNDPKGFIENQGFSFDPQYQQQNPWQQQPNNQQPPSLQ